MKKIHILYCFVLTLLVEIGAATKLSIGCIKIAAISKDRLSQRPHKTVLSVRAGHHTAIPSHRCAFGKSSIVTDRRNDVLNVKDCHRPCFVRAVRFPIRLLLGSCDQQAYEGRRTAADEFVRGNFFNTRDGAQIAATSARHNSALGHSRKRNRWLQYPRGFLARYSWCSSWAG